MVTYFSTIISGTNTIVEKLLQEKLSSVEILHSFDGLIVFNSESAPEEVKQLRGLLSSFLMVKMFRNSTKSNADKLIKQSLTEPKILQNITQCISPKQYTFRIVTAEDNHKVTVSDALILQLEKRIGHRSHLRPNRRHPQNEIWFITRSEGYSFIGVRLTKNSFAEKVIPNGEVPLELAHLMCYLSEPTKDDVVLDPFAGSGSIVIERTNTKSAEIIAIEKSPSVASTLKATIATKNKKITVIEGDATNLSTIKNASIDKIITDPPGATYDQTIKIPKLYEKMFTEFIRVLKPGGIIVLLIGQKDETDKILHGLKDKLKVEELHDILISDKKARIYKLRNLL